VLENVNAGGWCAIRQLGLGPEYPGLQYELENKEYATCWKMLCNAGGSYTRGLVCLLLVGVLSIQDLMIQS
jgi:hypothetical protein